MPFDLEFDDDLAQRRLQRLEHRYRRAQHELATARNVYGSLRELHGATESQLHHALQQIERAQRSLADLQFDIEVAGARMAAPKGHVDSDYWNDLRG